MATSNRIDVLAEKISELSTKMDFFAEATRRNEEIIGGTAKTGGLKERLAIAEDNIRANKESFKVINENISTLRTEMLIEIGKLAPKKRGVNWELVLQAVVTAIAVGVTGTAFWQLIVWLAAHSPLK
jgi:hypothetical protein